MNFSIIIPLYNKEKHIKRTINSILQQTYQQFEIIVVDDGSTDSSYQEVLDIKDSRIKLYKKQNEGVSSARNYGIQKSTYEYIGLLDADDVWKPSFLESISKLIYKYPQAGAYATSYEFIRTNSVQTAKLNINLKAEQSAIVDYFMGALKQPLITASSVVIPKHVFEKIGMFSVDINKGEDLEMWCRIALNYEIAFLNSSLASYYLDADNRSTTTVTNYSKTFMSRAEKILEQQKMLGNKSIFFEEYMISRIMPRIRYLINNNKERAARALLLKYRHTRYNRKRWIKYYLLSYKIINLLYKKVK